MRAKLNMYQTMWFGGKYMLQPFVREFGGFVAARLDGGKVSFGERSRSWCLNDICDRHSVAIRIWGVGSGYDGW
jgi:hypothetical protein